MALIVVADDEFLLAEMLADLLEDAGHEVLTASQGEAALRLVRERRPELVITDFMMPLMTGLELAEAIRDDPAVSDIPILLVSGAQGMIARERSDLFVDVLDKPYDNRVLIDLVARLLADRHA
ncbi:response regulator [Tardibacter chloracetimidivorans]|uniref:Response regulator n=1 Tax=Tardibacter chloracetimidivorans TaxID=1921510 RepID=A0A1L3ZWG9_9SPHN|nr:response regulator [Tardibacter chloracetimidivorans]API59974.1 response regulator [Tardibacter chloracetimidivorans]